MTTMDIAPKQERFAPEKTDYQSTRTLGAFSLRSNQADMISTVRPGDFAFCYAPGWHTDGKTIAKNFDRHVEHFGTAHYGVHPEGTYSIDAQKEAWINARKRDGFRPAKIYAQSMGVLSVSHMFSDEGFRHDFGEVDSVCFDSGVSSRHDVRRLASVGMFIIRRLPNSDVADWLNKKAMESTLDLNPDFDVDTVTLEEACENSAASSRTGIRACKTQLQYMYSHDIANWDLSDFGKSIPNKKIISAPSDNVVDVDRSAVVINNSYGGGFTHLIDTARNPSTHAIGTERPRGIVDALTNQNTHKYRIKTIRNNIAVRAVSHH